jgi:hypothetical protein
MRSTGSCAPKVFCQDSGVNWWTVTVNDALPSRTRAFAD